MEGREPLQDLADHLLASSSHPALPESQELCWATDFPQLPSQYGVGDAAGSASLGGGGGGGAPGNGNDEDCSTGKEKKRKAGGGGYRMRNAAKPRFAFRTRSSEDVLDDGYRWRKYGQKAVKDSVYPRSYYRCAHPTCNVKKQVQRMSEDTSTVVTTYEGVHNHPSEQLMEALAPLLRQIQFLASC